MAVLLDGSQTSGEGDEVNLTLAGPGTLTMTGDDGWAVVQIEVKQQGSGRWVKDEDLLLVGGDVVGSISAGDKTVKAVIKEQHGGYAPIVEVQ